MSRASRPLTLTRVEDLTLGAFASFQPSETLNHLVRFLSTWSGSDKLFQVLQYSLKLIVPFLHLRARLQHRAGLRDAPLSSAANRLKKFEGIISDARMLFRMWGLIPIFEWLITIERNRPPTRRMLTIERLQGWSMLAYYPLEHLYYLLAHDIIPSKIPLPSLSAFIPFVRTKPSEKNIPLELGALGMWSTRFWAAYVILQLAHLKEDRVLLNQHERTLSKTKTGASPSEKADIKRKRDALWNELLVNVANLPLTIHWSLEKGLFQNEVWVGVFGLIAGLASWKSGWDATALPPTAPAPGPSGSGVTPLEPAPEKLAPPFDDPLKDLIEAPALDEM